MKDDNVLSAFVGYVDPDSNAILLDEYLDEYVVDAYVVEYANKYVRNKVPFEDYEDIMQNVHLKYWRKPDKDSIGDLRPYLGRMVINALNDYFRKQNRPIESNRVSLDTFYSNTNDENAAMEIVDVKASELDAHLCCMEHLEKCVAAIVEHFPPRRRLAAICWLKELMADQYGDLPLLIELFKQHNIDITDVEWPADEDERHKLKACFPLEYKQRLKKLCEDV